MEKLGLLLLFFFSFLRCLRIEWLLCHFLNSEPFYEFIRFLSV